jgi:MerR family transcriptional regulator, redox-sensitive transcriptional activator SoxR
LPDRLALPARLSRRTDQDDDVSPAVRLVTVEARCASESGAPWCEAYACRTDHGRVNVIRVVIIRSLEATPMAGAISRRAAMCGDGVPSVRHGRRAEGVRRSPHVQRDLLRDRLVGRILTSSPIPPSAHRYYEETAQIAAERNDSGHRRYPRGVLRRVAFGVFAQRVGLSLEEIRAELARLPRDRAPERTDWAKLSGGWTARIDDRIAELQRLKAGLTKCIGCGCLSLDRCQFANPGDRAARRGAGPRYWIERPRR